MSFTDLFIRRPVLASVISILILVLGLRSIFTLQIRQYPKMENTMISVTTTYPGASAELMQGFVTTPLEQSIAGADGIDYMTAASTENTSTINCYIKLNYDPNAALTDITGKVSAVRSQLPRDINDPVIDKQTGDQIDLMYMAYFSDQMTPEQITDYLTRVVVPQIETISGVAQAQILGGSIFAMRIWLNTTRMAALHVSPDDVVQALRANNYQAAAGQTKGKFVLFNVQASTDLHNAEQFNKIVVKQDGTTLIRIKDIGIAKLGAQNYDTSVSFNGKTAVFIGIQATPSANPLAVISKVREMFPQLQREFPPTLKAKIVYDSTKYIRASIHEVIATIFEAAIIVIVVIFLFLGAFRTVLIPMITIPLSLIGVCFLMLLLGYSLNLLTLLAMVLAIGLVVDDAIVVVENIYRHIEEGLAPLQAALVGAREIASPIISMTITLAAVYAPIGLLGGLTGSLFKEFAFTLAAAVVLSGVIALTLSPMMCAKILSKDISEKPFVKRVDQAFAKLKTVYQYALHQVLDYRPVMGVFATVILISCVFLFVTIPSELAPIEDQGSLFLFSTAPQYANIDYMQAFTNSFYPIFNSFDEKQDSFSVNGSNGVNQAFSAMILKPWDERKRTQQALFPLLQRKINSVAGLQIYVQQPAPLPGSSSGPPIQFVITTTTGFQALYEIAEKIRLDALDSGLFTFIDSTLKYNRPELNISINRNKARAIGINMANIGSSLAALLGENYVNWFSMFDRSYQVIPQVFRSDRFNPHRINQYYLPATGGQMVPLSSIVTLSTKVEPNTLAQFQQLNSATLQGTMSKDKTVSQGLRFLQQEAQKLLPKGMSYDYAGESRQFIQEGAALIYTFFFAILIIFLVLAAQFESYRDPLIILISVPMSICGALIPLNLGFATLNIYTEIGLVTLIGLISKHGILMVQFANQLQQQEGLSIREAIEKSAALRLRPILMTTAAMVMGVAPLLFATGAGAVSRFDIGLVITVGMTIGTCFTLFVVPTMYCFIAAKHQHKNVATA